MIRFLFWRFLFSQRSGSLIKSIAWLCLGGIIIGVAALILVMSVMNGFNNSIRGKLMRLEPHLVIQNATKASLKDFLIKHPDIQSQDYESQDVILRTFDGLYNGAVAKGMTKESLSKFINAVTRRNKLLAVENIELSATEILIGADLARTLGVYEGDLLTVIPPEGLLLPSGEVPLVTRVKIRSILSTELPEIDSTTLFYLKGSDLSQITNSTRQNGVELFLKSPSEFQGEQNELANQSFLVSNWQDRNSALFFALRMEKVIMATFLSLSALIASFSILSLMVLLLAQKSKEIGVMMAMGLSKTNARLIFIGLGQCLSWTGLGGGLILGVLTSLFLEWKPLRILPEDVYYDSAISAKVDFHQISWVLLGCLVVSVLASVIPVLRQLKMSPSEALRSQKSM